MNQAELGSIKTGLDKSLYIILLKRAVAQDMTVSFSCIFRLGTGVGSHYTTWSGCD